MHKKEEKYLNKFVDSKFLMDRDGFVVFKDVIDIKLIKKTRYKVIEHLKKSGIRSRNSITQPNAAVYIPFLKNVIANDEIIEKLKYLIEDEIVFTSHCDAHLGIMSDWHKDDGTSGGKSLGYFGKWMYGQKECKVYKVALYLQDHSKNSAGLSVIPGSHKTTSTEIKGRPITLNTNEGDIIIFDVRLTHAGQRDAIPLNWTKKNYWIKKNLDRLKNSVFLGKYINYLIKIIYSKIYGPKVAIFFTYGANNSWTSKFSVSNMKRQVSHLNNKKTKLPVETSNVLKKNKVIIFDKFRD